MMDVFEDVRAQEDRLLKDYRMRLESNTRATNLAKRILAIQNSPGFQDFVQAIEDLRQHVVRQMVSDSGTHEELRVLQGKAQALGDVLALLTRTESKLELLASIDQKLQAGLKAVQEAAPKAG